MPNPSLVAGVETTGIPRALKGDDKGVFKIHIVGNSGSGKSTLANELGAILSVPVIHLDEIVWRWVETPADVFQARFEALLASDACSHGWVVNGNYTRLVRGQLDGAIDVICLDLPLLLYFPRLIWRTFLRLLRLRAPCAPGCHEQLQETFCSRDGVLLFALLQHKRKWRDGYKRLHEDDVNKGGRMRRIGGWGGLRMHAR